MTGTLRIASDLALPLDYVTKAVAIMAQRRKGKTYTGSVLAEELVRLSQPWAALDPTGAWWGLRAAADGEREGLPVTILGGQHGDAPLDRTSGRVAAELVVDHPGWYVLDLSLLGSRAAERQFATDFGEALLRLKRQPGKDFPLHLFVDEADMFAPQEKETGEQRMLGAYQAIVRRGGLHGLGSTLITQRPALLNKSVLTQLDILILMRLVAGNDQDYVDKNYISRQASKEQRAEMMESLASLRIGEAWVWEPGADPSLFKRVQIRRRDTFNSSATPKPGEHRVEPKRLARVDLEVVTGALAEAIERVDSEDPAKLRARLAQLERERQADRAAHTAEIERLEAALRAQEPTVIERHVFDPELLARLETILTPSTELMAQLQDLLRWEGEDGKLTRTLREDLPRAGAGAGDSAGDRPAPRPPPGHAPVNQATAARRRAALAVAPERPDPPSGREPGRAPVPGPAPAAGRRSKLGDGATRRMLAVLATHGPLPPARAGFLAQISARKSTLRNTLSTLRTNGWINEGDGMIWPSDEGLEALGPYEPLPTGTALLEYWRGQVGSGKVRAIFEVLLEAHPSEPTNDEIAEAADIDPGVSTLRNGLSTLRSLGVVEGNRIAPALMEAINL